MLPTFQLLSFFQLFSDKIFSVNGILSKQGQILTEEKDVLSRWKEYFTELLNPERGTDGDTAEGGGRDESSPSFEEVLQVISSLKSGKAAAIDEIRSEMLKHLGVEGTMWLTRVIRVAWLSGRVPEDWQVGVIVPIFKKGNRKDCANYRGISLLSLPGKVFAKVLETRCRAVVEPHLGDQQCGFRPGRSTTDQLFALKMILEKSWEYAIPVYCCFIDLERAYDRIQREKLWAVLQEYGVDVDLLRAIQSLYKICRSCVRVSGQKSEMFDVSVGLRQGCVLSPLLFIIYMDRMLKRSLGPVGARIGEEYSAEL
ncbi:Reverse transcriptase domain [Sergentomyia squamirostris]